MLLYLLDVLADVAPPVDEKLAAVCEAAIVCTCECEYKCVMLGCSLLICFLW